MVDPYKELRLRNGNPVRSLIISQGHVYPVTGHAVLCNAWEYVMWTRDGRFCVGDNEPNPYDLVQA
jgi:hypothetical protein